ncbi:MAG: DUF1311 domain-containing protein [Cyanobacteria bacterium SIG30]|nr:DUF1311 domain-containing protein [Cyanobacteria bacterium SIG30]
MKKFVLIFTLIFFSTCTLISIVYAIKCNAQINKLNAEIYNLNNTISRISSENDKLSEDKNYKQKQHENLKLTKTDTELIDIEIQECMKSCNYTTVCMNNCTYYAIPKWEKEINKNLKLLEEIMNKEQIELLNDTQNKWSVFKDAQQKLNRETIGTMSGTIYTNILAGEQIYLIESRAKELKNLYSTLSEQ